MADKGHILDNYLLWELCKQKYIQRRIIEGSFDRQEIKKIVEKVRQEYRENDYSLDEKFNQVRVVSSNPDHKVKMFEYCSWEKETVKIGDLGTTLPNAMGLPPEVISGTLPEVVEFVKEADPEEYRSVKYINCLKDVSEVLNGFIPNVITPASIIRRQDRMRKHHGEKDWNIEDTWGAIHDGNHRTVAKILADDLEEIECYVGRPATDKIYEHVELEE